MTRAAGRRREMTDVVNPDSVMVETEFFNPFDGTKGRDGGPYLDAVERQAAEINRAKAEDREPADLNGPLPSTAGTPLVVAANVVDNLMSNPSMAHSKAKSDPVITLEVDEGTGTVEDVNPYHVPTEGGSTLPDQGEGANLAPLGNFAPSSPPVDTSVPVVADSTAPTSDQQALLDSTTTTTP